MKSLENKSAIVIPTLNRLEFVFRQLNFYQVCTYKISIYIGISDPILKYEYFKLKIKEENFNFPIKLYHIPELNAAQAIQFLVKNVEEKFVAFCGDDDFLIPNSIIQCENILLNDPTISIVQGKSILISHKEDKKFGKVDSISNYINYTINSNEKSYKRIENFSFNYFTPQFSLHRTNEFLLNLSGIDLMEDRQFTELLSNYADLAIGKSHTINSLYLVRTVHNERITLVNGLDWITSKNFLQSYTIFIEKISTIVSRLDNIPLKDAQEKVKNALAIYIGKSLLNKSTNKKEKISFIIFLLNKFPLIKEKIKNLYYQLKYLKYGNDFRNIIKFLNNYKINY